VDSAGLFSSLATYIKLIPLLLVALLGLFFADFHNFSEFNPSGESLLSAAGALAPLTMFAYLGLESATVPAGDVRDPQRTVPRSTMLGVGISALVYVFGTLAVMGVIPREQLAQSSKPFSEAASFMWGPWAGGAFSVAIMISSLGALNGWTLMMGQVPMAAAQDGLFPAVFGRKSARGVPAFGIVISVILASALLLVQASGASSFVAFYRVIVNLSTMTAVVPYVFCALAGGIIAYRSGGAPGGPSVGVVEVVAFTFSMFTVWGCGTEAVLYGFLLLMLGLPVYVWQVTRGQETQG
jgi:amino acid transporter